MAILRTVVFVAATAGLAIGCGSSAKKDTTMPRSTAPKANPCATPDKPESKPDKPDDTETKDTKTDGAGPPVGQPPGGGSKPADGGNPDG